MTLITYSSRVHFADGVLEVALSSELELNKLCRPMLVYEQNGVDGEFIERVVAGLPYGCESAIYKLPESESLERVISELHKKMCSIRADVVIAFGSSNALSVADAGCRTLHCVNNNTPVFYAIPGVDGIPNMSARRRIVDPGMRTGGGSPRAVMGSGIVPDMVIIDPTLIVGESVQRTASAVAQTLARCLSAHFSDNYNPPADGIALEGCKRVLNNLDELIIEDSLEMRRELMAASLNGTLAMQKDTGLAHDLCETLIKHSGKRIDKGALMRLLIVVEADLLEQAWTVKRRNEIRSALGVPSGQGLRDWLSSILEALPLPESLQQMGIEPREIESAAKELAPSRATVPGADRLGKMLHGVEVLYRAGEVA